MLEPAPWPKSVGRCAAALPGRPFHVPSRGEPTRAPHRWQIVGIGYAQSTLVEMTQLPVAPCRAGPCSLKAD